MHRHLVRARRLAITGALLSVLIALMNPGAVLADAVPPPPAVPLPAGTVPSPLPVVEAASAEGTGTTLTLPTDPPVSVISGTPIEMRLERVPDIVSLRTGTSSAGSTTIEIRGLAPSTTYYRYEDGYSNRQEAVTDEAGTLAYTQDLSTPHETFLQLAPSTIFLTEDGWSDPLAGTWDPLTRIATLSRDLAQTVQIDVDDVTVDGAGHALIGTRSINGVYLLRRNGVTIRNLTISGFSSGIYASYCAGIRVLGVDASHNAASGIYLYMPETASVTACTASSNLYGIRLSGAGQDNVVSGNTLQENTLYDLLPDSVSRPLFQTLTAEDNTGSGGRPIVVLHAGGYLASSTVAQLILAAADGAEVTDVTVEGSSAERNNGVNVSCTAGAALDGVSSSGNQRGVWIDSSSGIVVSDATACGNAMEGVRVERSAETSVVRLAAAGNLGAGVTLRAGSGNALSGSSLTGNRSGLYLDDTTGAQVSDNIIGDSTQRDLEMNATTDGACANTVNGNTGSGGLPIVYYSGAAVHLSGGSPMSELVLANADGSTLENVIVEGSPALANNGILLWRSDGTAVSGALSSDNMIGVDVRSSADVTVSGCDVRGSGIAVLNSPRPWIAGNDCTGSDTGVSLYYCTSALAEDNTCTGGRNGIVASYTTGSVIRGNTAAGSVAGIQCAVDSDNVVSDNTVHGPGMGIDLYGSKRDVVSGNDVRECSIGLAVRLAVGSSLSAYNEITGNIVADGGLGIQTTSSFNRIYANDFLRNVTQALGYGAANDYNLDRPVGGNHWSDWTGPDADADGFVDVPYAFNGDSDDLPLARPVNDDTQAPVTTLTLDASAPDGSAGWYVTRPVATLTAGDSDGSGVASIEYSYDGVGWTAYETPFAVAGEGEVMLFYRSTDARGNVEAARTAVLLIDTQAPSLTLSSASLSITEGAVAVNFVTANDDLGIVAVAASDGELLPDGDGAWAWTLAAPDGPDDGRTVTVTAGDGHGNVTSASFELTVLNVAPAISIQDAVTDPMLAGTSITMSASVSDPGADSHTVRWDWDDGTTSTSGVDVEGSTSGAHVYSSPGVYSVRAVVTDDDGATGEDSSEYYVVVYDPEAGWVTGGGWIASPAGAYVANPSLTGKASFGFVSKYDKGADLPKGETEFQFRTAGLDFHSSSYQWLVVAGAKAQYKGAGAISGVPGYSFMLTAVDGALTPSSGDTFRIKIWETASGTIVYDNQLGAIDGEDPSTTLGGGNITIHQD